MRRARYSLLCAVIVTALLLTLVTAASARYVQTSAWPNIQWTGVDTDRGFAINKNPDSPYYCYLYTIDGLAGSTGRATERTIRVLRPDPIDAGPSANNYVDTGVTIVTPGTDLITNVYVGSDSTVWAANYTQKKVRAYAPDGSTMLAEIATAESPRDVCVTGSVNVAGARVFVAESTWGSPTYADKCEIFEFDGTSWNRVMDLGTLGLVRPWSVTVDNAGNSYWSGTGSSTVVKVKNASGSYAVDSSFVFAKPSWLNSITPHCVRYVNDPVDVINPEYLYVSYYGIAPTAAGGTVSCPGLIRVKMTGATLDGFGQTYNVKTYPSAIYNGLEIASPGGDNIYYMNADNNHNIYLYKGAHDWVNNSMPGYQPGISKIARQDTWYLAPDAPTNGSASNDIYGQIRLAWTNNARVVPPSFAAPISTCNIYRSTDTTRPATPYASVYDGFNKWKDSVQGQTPGGPFYYWVSAVNVAGESGILGPIGPISPIASTAPVPRSKTGKIAVTYSEYSDKDPEVGNISSYWTMVSAFLDKRGVSYDKIWDANPAELNIENDDIAGYPLLFLVCNRDMSSLEAQCIKDYVNYSRGRIISCYWNGEAGTNWKTLASAESQLASIYGVHRIGWAQDNRTTINGVPATWDARTFRYAKATAEPDAAKLFDGIPEVGALQPASIPIAEVVEALPGAKVIANWANASGVGPYDPGSLGGTTGHPTWNAAVVANYDTTGEPISLYYGIMWWWRMPETPNAVNASYSATKLVENALNFYNWPFTKVEDAGTPLGDRLVKAADNQTFGFGELKVTMPAEKDVTIGNMVYDMYYVETKDRSAGIKARIPKNYVNALSPDGNLASGQLVTVSGNLTSETEKVTVGTSTKTVCGDRVLEVWEVWKSGGAPTEPAKPLYMPTKSVVGPYIGHQQGVYGASGLNNLGLYVKITGKVTYYEADASEFVRAIYIDDGCGLMDGTTHLDTNGQPVPNVGIRVVFPAGLDLPLAPGYLDPALVVTGREVSVTGCTALSLIGAVVSDGAKGPVGLRAVRIPVDYNDLDSAIQPID